MKEKKCFEYSDSDDSIEDVSSFEEARAIISQRLSNLREDLSIRTGAEALAMVSFNAAYIFSAAVAPAP